MGGGRVGGSVLRVAVVHFQIMFRLIFKKSSGIDEVVGSFTSEQFSSVYLSFC